MSKVDEWLRQQYFDYEFKRAKERRGVTNHQEDCLCRACRDARYYANQESE